MADASISALARFRASMAITCEQWRDVEALAAIAWLEDMAAKPVRR